MTDEEREELQAAYDAWVAQLVVQRMSPTDKPRDFGAITPELDAYNNLAAILRNITTQYWPKGADTLAGVAAKLLGVTEYSRYKR